MLMLSVWNQVSESVIVMSRIMTTVVYTLLLYSVFSALYITIYLSSYDDRVKKNTNGNECYKEEFQADLRTAEKCLISIHPIRYFLRHVQKMKVWQINNLTKTLLFAF
jgi:hypothetical protein